MRQHGTSAGTAAGAAGGSACGWVRSPCLGLCERAPAVLVTGAGEQPWNRVVAPANCDATGVLEGQGATEDGSVPPAETSVPQAGDSSLHLLHRVGTLAGRDLDGYRRSGGFDAFGLALERGAEWAIQQVEASRLSVGAERRFQPAASGARSRRHRPPSTWFATRTSPNQARSRIVS